MQRAPTPSLLLDVWREVGRHIEIAESVERIAPILAQTLPVARVAVLRLDRATGQLVTLAEGGERRASEAARRELAAAELALLSDWLKQGATQGPHPPHVQAWRKGQGDRLRTLLAPGAADEALVAGVLREGSAA